MRDDEQINRKYKGKKGDPNLKYNEEEVQRVMQAFTNNPDAVFILIEKDCEDGTTDATVAIQGNPQVIVNAFVRIMAKNP